MGMLKTVGQLLGWSQQFLGGWHRTLGMNG
jgi:hypothetical protein